MAFKSAWARDDSGSPDDAGEAAARARDPISALSAWVGAKLPGEDLADFDRLVAALVEHIGRSDKTAATGANDSLTRDLRRRVLVGDAKMRAEAGTSLESRFPALSRIGGC